MEKTEKTMEFTNENAVETQVQAKVSDLFKEVVEVITDSFVATYEVKDNSLIMRIPNGKKFRISVESAN